LRRVCSYVTTAAARDEDRDHEALYQPIAHNPPMEPQILKIHETSL